jgi:GT2 family glycosyltransferase
MTSVRRDTPFVSIVIPCYNQAKFLRDAIASARAQRVAAAEIVVVDDGSTDDTAVVAARHRDVRVVRQPNAGLAAARNRGLSESRGEYLIFLDADDLLLPDAVAAGLAAFRERPEAAFVFGDYHYADAAGAPLRPSEWIGVRRDEYASLLRGNAIGMHATVMYRRRTLERFGGFDTRLRAAEDYDLYLRVARRQPIHQHAGVVALYRQHGENMSRDVGLMLHSVLRALRAQRRTFGGDRRLWIAYHEGVANWRGYYGDVLRERLRAHRVAGDHVAAARAALALACCDGRRVARALVGRVTRRWRSSTTRARVSRADLGALGRLQPISRSFGFDRGRPVDRYYIEAFLRDHAAAVRGRVLEVGDDTYTWRFGADRLSRSDVLHIADGAPPTTFVGSLAAAPHLPAGAFDCVILTQTLHLIHDVRAAIATVHRILRPGGVALVTVPGISQIADDQWRSAWCWGFTRHSIRRLFEEQFPADHVSVEVKGNVLAATAFLHGVASEELRHDELDHADPRFEVTLLVRATRPAEEGGLRSA